jgi:hypothetical protein
LVIPLACVVGCDQLFKLDHLEPLDAAPDATTSSCENPAPFTQDCRPLTLPLTSDTFLSAANPDTPFGLRDALHISDDGPALLKFDTTAIAAGERIASLKLTLDPYFSVSTLLCGTNATCGVCPAPSIGAWSLHWAITGWNQSNTTWNLADSPATAWATPGAAAIPIDRSERIASGTGAPSLLIIDVGSEALLAHSPDCYRSADRLALLVTVEGGAYFDASEDTPCDNGGAERPPLLEALVCR